MKNTIKVSFSLVIAFGFVLVCSLGHAQVIDKYTLTVSDMTPSPGDTFVVTVSDGTPGTDDTEGRRGTLGGDRNRRGGGGGTSNLVLLYFGTKVLPDGNLENLQLLGQGRVKRGKPFTASYPIPEDESLFNQSFYVVGFVRDKEDGKTYYTNKQGFEILPNDSPMWHVTPTAVYDVRNDIWHSRSRPLEFAAQKAQCGDIIQLSEGRHPKAKIDTQCTGDRSKSIYIYGSTTGQSTIAYTDVGGSASLSFKDGVDNVVIHNVDIELSQSGIKFDGSDGDYENIRLYDVRFNGETPKESKWVIISYQLKDFIWRGGGNVPGKKIDKKEHVNYIHNANGDTNHENLVFDEYAKPQRTFLQFTGRPGEGPKTRGTHVVMNCSVLNAVSGDGGSAISIHGNGTEELDKNGKRDLNYLIDNVFIEAETGCFVSYKSETYYTNNGSVVMRDFTCEANDADRTQMDVKELDNFYFRNVHTQGNKTQLNISSTVDSFDNGCRSDFVRHDSTKDINIYGTTYATYANVIDVWGCSNK